MMKKVLTLFFAAVMALSLTACGNAAKREDASGGVYWLNFKPESDGVLQQVAKRYTDETGVVVRIVTAASGKYNETLTAEMDKSDPPTLFVLGNTGALATWGDYAMDLRDTPIAAELTTDAYNIVDENGKLCSIGYCYECYGIIVNVDLLQKAGYTTADLVNFEGLKRVAEDITARKDELGFAAFSSNAMDSSSAWRFTGHMANLEYYYESVDDPDAWKACPATIKGTYLENFRQLYDLCVNNSTVERSTLAAGGTDAEKEMLDNKAVFFVNGSWEFGTLADGGLKNLTMIPYYCGVAGEEKAGLNCGTENCWAINDKASESDKKATMDFMVWMVTDPDASAMLTGTFGAMPYKSAAVSDNGFLAAAENYSRNGHYVMTWETTYQPNVDTYREGLVSALNAYNAEPTDANWNTFRTAFVDGWATQYRAAYGD